MSATLTFTEDDYVGAYKLAGRPTRRWWLWHGAVGILLVVAGLMTTSAILRFGFFGALVGGAFGHIAVQLWWRPLQARRAFRTTKAPLGPVELILEPDGLRLKATDGEALIRWSHIYRWRQGESAVLIYENQSIFRIVPRRIQGEGLDFALLEDKLRKYVGSST